MDPQTVETFLMLGKLGLILGGGCTLVMGTLYSLGAATVQYYQRKDQRDELMPLYLEGKISTKPTILNAYTILGPETGSQAV